MLLMWSCLKARNQTLTTAFIYSKKSSFVSEENVCLLEKPKTESGYDFYSAGRGSKRIRNSFATSGEALRYEREQLANNSDSSINTIEAKARAVRLNELFTNWYELYGRSLSNGDARLQELKQLCHNLVDSDASTLESSEMIADV